MWQIKLTALDDENDYIILEEYTGTGAEEIAKRMFEWYQNKMKFFNGTLSLEKGLRY